MQKLSFRTTGRSESKWQPSKSRLTRKTAITTLCYSRVLTDLEIYGSLETGKLEEFKEELGEFHLWSGTILDT